MKERAADKTGGQEDRAIEQSIMEEIRSDPFIASEHIKVTSKNGVVTLKGIVNSLTESAAATADAFQGGAREVKNHLKVRVDQHTYRNFL